MAAESTLTHTTHDGHTLVCTVAGDPAAPPAILLHGWLSHRGVWRTTLPTLAQTHYCLAPDLIGFGESDKPPAADVSIPTQAARILALADDLHLDQFTLIGHSMGGQIATYLAACLAPHRVHQLVNIGGVVTGRLQPYVRYFTWPLIMLCRAAPPLYFTAQFLSRFRWYDYIFFRPWFYHMDHLPFDEWAIDRQKALQITQAHSAYAAGRGISALDLTPHLLHILAPTLAIHGQQDGTVPVSEAQHLAAHVPTSITCTLDDCGHFPMFEQPAAYLDALCRFLDNGRMTH